MVNSSNQLGMFEKMTHVVEMPNADVTYTPNYFSIAKADSLYDQLTEETKWRQEIIKVFGKKHLTPRLSCWMGDDSLSYRYSNMTMIPVPWSTVLLKIKMDLEAWSGEGFNSVLINYYRDGQDSNGWHSDDEVELGKDPVIASISLGASRDFHLRHKQSKQKIALTLENGSLLIMRGDTQRYWQHQVPKRANAAGRINLTFRSIKQPYSD